jgi:type IV secretory pathway ATPase VirB11/archaellum biosynthesis ATPase
LEYDEKQFLLTDAGSTNGTYINGSRAEGTTRILAGDKIYIGDYMLSLEGHDALIGTGSMPPQVPPKVPIPAAKISQEVSRPSAADPDEFQAVMDVLLNTVIEQIESIDRTRIPARVNSGLAGKVRFLLRELVRDSVTRGKLPVSVDPGLLIGKAFRSVVYLGPLAGWLDDSTVDSIRITGPGSAFLLKDGNWIQVPDSYADEEDFVGVLRCLGAGREPEESTSAGGSWFRLEEGYTVFSSLYSNDVSNITLVIDKTVSTNFIDEKAQVVINEAIHSKSKIALVGGTGALRSNALGELAKMLPGGAFAVTVEDSPSLSVAGSDGIKLSAKSGDGAETASADFRSLVLSGVNLEPDWLIVSGTTWSDVPTVLNAAASRSGVIAELPLGAVGQLECELAAVMASSGASVSLDEVSLLIEEAFDIIVIVGRETGGGLAVEKILESGVSEQGHWSPRSLFDRISRN